MNFQLKNILSSLARTPRTSGLLLCLSVLFGSVLSFAQLQAALDFSLQGWATAGNGTTGGAGGKTVTVSTPEDFLKEVSGSEPRIVYVKGTIDFAKLPTNHSNYGKTRQDVGSNKSILGLGNNATIRGGDLALRGVSNVIIRNITFRNALDTSIGLRGATHIWIDHNDFAASPDGLLDITQASDYVTVSWNRFSNHNKTSLVGSSDGMTSDRGRLRVTYHNNWFQKTSQRHPRVRFGQVHVFNNYFTDVDIYAIGIGVEAQIVSENNYMDGVSRAWRLYDSSSQPGYFLDSGSIYRNVGSRPSTSSSGIKWSPSKTYRYALAPAGDVPSIVTAYSGVGVIDPTSANPTPEPDPEPLPPVEERDPVGLIAYYPLTEGAGDTAKDHGGFESPLDLRLAGGATWLTGGGVSLGGGEAQLIAKSSSAKLAEQIAGTGQLSVEVWARPGHLNQPDEGSHPARILSFSRDGSDRNFMLGHGGHEYQGPEMAVRLRTTSTADDTNGMPNVVASGAISDAMSQYVVTFDGAYVRMYRDGELQHTEQREGELANWDPGHTLILGNEVGGHRGWVGELYSVAIFDRALTEDEIHERLSPPVEEPSPEEPSDPAPPTGNPSFAMQGWATVGKGTTGGAGGRTVTASTPAEFVEYISKTEPLIIEVVGTIDLSRLSSSHPGYKSNGRYQVESNKTIVGRGSDAHITRGDLRLHEKTNVIIRNIRFSRAPDTALGISGGTTHVWVDHNEFADGYDGLLDITQGSDLITVSWNRFSNHNKVSLVGSSDGHTGDRGRLRVTYHHNWFNDTWQRLPRVRYGRVHVFNNYMTGVDSYAIGIGVEAQIVSEKNYMNNVSRAWRLYDTSSQPGYFTDSGSIYKNVGSTPSTKSSGIDWSPGNFYDYASNPAEDVPALVQAYSGIGVIDPLAPDEGPLPEIPEERDVVGLVAYYPLTEGTGSTARDESGFEVPLDLTLAGGATWLNGGGVSLGGGEAQLIAKGSAAKLAKQIAGTNQMTLEVWAKPGHLNQPDEGSHPSRIVSFSKDGSNRNFMLGHGGEGYQGPEMAFRLRTTGSTDDMNGMPNIVASSTISDAKSHYVVTFDGKDVRMYRDAELQYTERREGTLANWDPNYTLILGNEVGGHRGWVGEIYSVAIFDRALDHSEIQERAGGLPAEGEAMDFAEWLRETFPDADITDPTADPGGYGVPLLLRYALGLDPHSPNRDQMHTVALKPNPTSGNDFLTIEFNRRKGSEDAVVVEVSEDLRNWVPLGQEAVVNVVENGDLETVTVRDPVPVSQEQQRFIRIRVDLPASG